mmetsp:Transcript_4749/g.11196  ORF Transcript_4749/g.11196 Transcript_4749/m.11196 type:complete len:502 (+) Transcript_4749:15-1520(+)
MGNVCGGDERRAARSAPSATATADGGSQNRSGLKRPKGGGFSLSNFISDNPGKIEAFYNVSRSKLGEGSYGSVSEAVHRASGSRRAAKVIAKAHVSDASKLGMEIEIMKVMDHPNIIKLYETFSDHRSIYLIMELASGGELFDRIIEAQCLKEADAACIMQQIFRAVFYMHENQICHRDLKPENFLFSSREPIDVATLKLIDFGLSCKVRKGQVLRTKAGTPYYVAPQVLKGAYGIESDVWSCGVIMYVLLCGYPPFYGDTDREVLQKVASGNFEFRAADWRGVSNDAKDLISATLKVKPQDRFSAGQCLNHIWVKKKAPNSRNVPLEAGIMANMRNFRSQNKLKKAAIQIIAQSLDDNELKRLKDLFTSLDKNGDGSLTPEELRKGLQEAGLGQKGEDLAETIKQIDADGSGQIDYTEFLAAAMDKKTYLQEERLWAAFRVFDKDGNGKITATELRQVLLSGSIDDVANAQQIQDLVKDVDKNGDGEIDFDEFVEMMKRT